MTMSLSNFVSKGRTAEPVNSEHFGIHLEHRQRGLIDTTILSTMRVGGVGLSRSLLTFEVLASSGLRDFILCDPQTVSAENIGQTGFRSDEIGLPKVEAVKTRLYSLNHNVGVETYQCRAEEITELRELVRTLDVLKIGVDDPVAQFRLSDLAQETNTPAVVAGTTGDNMQHFVVLVMPDGPPLRALLPEAWKGVQAGYRPPEFFPSCRLNAETVSVQAARVILAVLHRRGRSSLPIGEIADAMITRPLMIGLNGLHEASGFLTPTRLLEPPS